MNINEAIKRGKFILEKNLIKNSQLDSEILMSKVINKDRKFVILNSKNELDEKKLNYFKNLIFERSKGKPIAYLTYKKTFGSMSSELKKIF